jgi:LPS-assembly lipoprotein
MGINSSSLSLLKIAISALLLCTIASCGFSLRGDYLISPELQRLYVSSTDTHSELTRVLKQQLTINKVQVVKNFAADIPELRLLKDSLDRRTLSVFDNGQVAEYELIYTVRYQLRLANSDIQSFTFEINRDYQDDPDRALAKSRELKLILSEMRQQAATDIVRNIASIQP